MPGPWRCGSVPAGVSWSHFGSGWRVFVSTNMMDVPVVTDQRSGVIGIDLNADHLAVAETDASGNCLNAWRVPLVTYGKSTHQAEALIGDAVA